MLARTPLDSTDVTVIAFDGAGSWSRPSEFRLHKFLLAARSPYFRRKLKAHANRDAPGTAVRAVRLADSVDARAFETAVKFMYLSEVFEPGRADHVLVGLERLSRLLEMPQLWDAVVVESENQKKRRQQRAEAVEKAQDDLDRWFRESVLAKKICLGSVEEAQQVRVEQDNEFFADVLLMAEGDGDEDDGDGGDGGNHGGGCDGDDAEAIAKAKAKAEAESKAKVVLYPVHKGMLRSEFFAAMFAGYFKEGRQLHQTEALPIVPIDTSPAVLEHVLSFLYSERGDIPLELALDCLMIAEQLLLDRLKHKCSHVISSAGQNDNLPYPIYDVVRAGWLFGVRRLEEFGAKYIADRLERYLADPELAELVAESAQRIRERQETDTIELVDDIRYYLAVRFKQRIGEEDPLFEGGLGLDDEPPEPAELGRDDAFFDRRGRQQEELLGQIDELLGELPCCPCRGAESRLSGSDCAGRKPEIGRISKRLKGWLLEACAPGLRSPLG